MNYGQLKIENWKIKVESNPIRKTDRILFLCLFLTCACCCACACGYAYAYA